MSKQNNERLSYKLYEFFAPITLIKKPTEFEDEVHFLTGIGTEINEMNEAIELAYSKKCYFKSNSRYKVLKPNDLDIPNFLEEIGDTIWYIINLGISRNINFELELFGCEDYDIRTVDLLNDLEFLSLEERVRRLSIEHGKLSDVFKKRFAYGKVEDTEQYNLRIKNIASCLFYILRSFKHYLEDYDYDMENVLYTNIKKLSKRFDVDNTKLLTMVENGEGDKVEKMIEDGSWKDFLSIKEDEMKNNAINRDVESEYKILKDLSNEK